jgi:hypothetical protein
MSTSGMGLVGLCAFLFFALFVFPALPSALRSVIGIVLFLTALIMVPITTILVVLAYWS